MTATDSSGTAGRGRVLVVDDDAALAEMLTIVLRQEGFDSRVCPVGNRALADFREYRPDVVLLDLDTPGVEDVEQWVTALEAMTTVVLVCPRDVDEARLVALEASGALLVLVKPLPSEWLMHALHHAIAESRGSRGPRPVAA